MRRISQGPFPLQASARNSMGDIKYKATCILKLSIKVLKASQKEHAFRKATLCIL